MGPGCGQNAFSTSEVLPCTGGFIYDTEVFRESVVSKFDLVCEHEFYNLTLAGISLLGILVGSLCGGVVADRFGRKTALVWGVTLTIPQLFLAGFSPNYWVYALFRYYFNTSV